MGNLITTNPKILGGTPCFSGTRVPVKSLFDYLENGSTVDYFLIQFTSVGREQVLAILEHARQNAEHSTISHP